MAERLPSWRELLMALGGQQKVTTEDGEAERNVAAMDTRLRVEDKLMIKFTQTFNKADVELSIRLQRNL